MLRVCRVVSLSFGQLYNSFIIAFEQLLPELEANGFELGRLSGRTVAIKAVPAMLVTGAAQSLLVELLDAVEEDRKGLSLDELRAEIATGLACRAAIKINIEPIKLCCHPQSRTKFHEAEQLVFLRVSSCGFVDGKSPAG